MDNQIQGQTGFEIQEPGIENAGKTIVVDTTKATVLLSLDSMIKEYLQRLSTLSIDLKKIKEMYDDAFLNNPAFIENQAKAKEAGKDLLVTKKNIASQPAQVQLHLKMKTMREEIKEIKSSLSDYLQEYARMTGATQLELFDGTVGDIVLTAKVVKRSANR